MEKINKEICPHCQSEVSRLVSQWPYSYFIVQHRRCFYCEKWYRQYINPDGSMWIMDNNIKKQPVSII